MRQRDEMVIFTRTFDFLAWLLPAVEHFPRAHRHGFTHKLVDSPAGDHRSTGASPVVAFVRKRGYRRRFHRTAAIPSMMLPMPNTE